MKHLKPTLLFALGLFALTACVKQKTSADGRRDGAALSSFAGSGKLCDTHLAFVAFAKDGPAAGEARAFTSQIDLAVCGTVDGTDETEWMAIAASLTTSDVFLRTSLAAGAEERGHLARRADGSVAFIGDGGTQLAIGTLAGTDEGAPLELKTDVGAYLMVDDEPFVLEKHAKDVEGQRLVLVAPGA